ncbi:MAG: hypothetical protein WCH11_05120, partial [Bdellovibrio sp.]
MKFSLFFCGLLVVGLGAAQAQRFVLPCGRSYKEDSVGRGIEYGVRRSGGPAPNGQHDEACFRMGSKEGEELKKQDSSEACSRDFDRGFDEGFRQDLQSAGSMCFVKGREAGAAWLRSKARELSVKDVGSECVMQYQNGRKST